MFKGVKNNAIWYNNKTDLTEILLNFDPIKHSNINFNAYKEYTPENVMKVFNDIFLK
jgi:hypothetical protein